MDRNSSYVWWCYVVVQLGFLVLPETVLEFDQVPADADLITLGTLAVVGLVVGAIGLGMFHYKLVRPIAEGRLDLSPDSPDFSTNVFVPFLRSLSFIEALAIYGFVVRQMGYGLEFQLPFAAAALAGAIWMRPDQAKLRRPNSF